MLFYLHHKSDKLSDEVQNAGLRASGMESAVRGGHRCRGKPAHTEQNENEKTKNKISNSTEQKKEPLEGPDDQRTDYITEETGGHHRGGPHVERAQVPRGPRHRDPSARSSWVNRVRPLIYIIYTSHKLENGASTVGYTHREPKQTVRFLLLPLGDAQSRRTWPRAAWGRSAAR